MAPYVLVMVVSFLLAGQVQGWAARVAGGMQLATRGAYGKGLRKGGAMAAKAGMAVASGGGAVGAALATQLGKRLRQSGASGLARARARSTSARSTAQTQRIRHRGGNHE